MLLLVLTLGAFGGGVVDALPFRHIETLVHVLLQSSAGLGVCVPGLLSLCLLCEGIPCLGRSLSKEWVESEAKGQKISNRKAIGSRHGTDVQAGLLRSICCDAVV